MPATIAIAIALVAVAVAIAAWFTPAPKAEVPAAKTYTEQETADAKKAVCEAFDRGQATLSVTGRKTGADPNAAFAIAVNSRIAINTVIGYWRTVLQREPAAPEALAHDVIRLADTYEDILLRLLADATDSDLSGLYESVDRSVPVVVQACK